MLQNLTAIDGAGPEFSPPETSLKRKLGSLDAKKIVAIENSGLIEGFRLLGL